MIQTQNFSSGIIAAYPFTEKKRHLLMDNLNARRSRRRVQQCSSLPVVLLVHQVVACTEGHQVGVVGRCRDGDRAGAAHVGVAQLVGEHL